MSFNPLHMQKKKNFDDNRRMRDVSWQNRMMRNTSYFSYARDDGIINKKIEKEKGDSLLREEICSLKDENKALLETIELLRIELEKKKIEKEKTILLEEGLKNTREELSMISSVIKTEKKKMSPVRANIPLTSMKSSK